MSSFFPSRPVFIGVDVSASSNKVAVLRKSRKGWAVTYLKQTPIAENVNPLYSLPKEGVVISAFPSRDVLVRPCEIPLKKDKDLFAALDFQVEPLLPYSTDQAIIQAQLIDKMESRTALTAFAIRKDHLSAYLEQLKFEPELVTCVPYALASFSTLLPQAINITLLIHMGEEEVTCVLVENGKLLASRSFDRSRDLLKEVEKTVLSFSSSHKHKYFETIYFLSSDGLMREQIQNTTGKNVLFPSSASLHLSHEELIRFAIAIGSAISAEGPNFRQKEFAYPTPWKRVKTPLVACFIFSLLLLGGVFGYEQASLNRQKSAIHDAYLSLIAAEGKMLSQINMPDQISEYQKELKRVEGEIQARPDTYPLYPQVPQVKEVLAWLNSYPQLTIDSFQYSMQKRPDLSHKKEHYKIRVDLEFNAKNQTAARSFHESLLSQSSFVDTKEEVLWSTGKGKYRASFYLKDRTRYL